MDKACCKGFYVAIIYSNEVAGKETGNLDSVALYFDLVYNLNDSSSQEGRHLGKKAVPCVENREKT